MENILGQLLNQLVCNRANSLEGGQLAWKIEKITNRSWPSLPSISVSKWGQRDMDTYYKQLIDFQYLQYKSNYTIGEHEHGKYRGSAPQPTRLEQAELIWKSTSSPGKEQKSKLILQ